MSSAPALTQSQIDEYKEAFDLFDQDGDGLFSPDHLGTILRSLGLNPTKAELEDMINSLDMMSTNGQIDFPMFLDIMLKMNGATKEDTEEEIIEAFKVFDKEGNGILSAEQVRHIMKNQGLKDNTEDINEMIKAAGFEIDGPVDYKEFIKIMMAK